MPKVKQQRDSDGAGAAQKDSTRQTKSSGTSGGSTRVAKVSVRVAELPKIPVCGIRTCHYCDSDTFDAVSIGWSRSNTIYRCQKCDSIIIGLPKVSVARCEHCGKGNEVVESKNGWNTPQEIEVKVSACVYKCELVEVDSE
jgi:hypothetical protein